MVHINQDMEGKVVIPKLCVCDCAHECLCISALSACVYMCVGVHIVETLPCVCLCAM